jgi:hypothetical protein
MFVLGLLVLREYTVIRRVHGLDRPEIVGIMVIVALTVIVTSVLCFCGYVIDMVRLLASRSARDST